MKNIKFITSYLLFYVTLMFASYAGAEPFQIVHKKKSTPILFDQKDAEVVRITGKALAKDIKLITDIQPDLLDHLKTDVPRAIIIGTLGKSKLIDQLAAQKKISKATLEGKWETFLLQIISNPIAGIGKALVIAGSDPRGTAFGVLELSKRLGVSPWVWWADVKPEQQKNLSIDLDEVVLGPPSIKFRGIFLNDEDWGLQPWAASNIDTDIKDIGPKTYARIFELLLRLKGNFIWTAMHPCTKAFFFYEGNPKVAAQYDIVVGASHCEPMLRNNVDEWKNNFETEYGEKPGPWRYDINKRQIHRYWEDRVIQAKDLDAVYTVGMRGIHDGSMPGPKTVEGKIELLNKIIEDQRAMLVKHGGKDADEIPQIFCPYKEVLHLYQQGAKVPDDVTIVWADDNHGYIRKLSTPEEQKRSGHSGIYYHLSYWGAPADYLWLSSISPSLISYEMSKAHAYGADRLWVFNVGDIKPAELETEFAMDLAWDVNAWPPKKAEGYTKEWATRIFGKKTAKKISEIKKTYYKLAASGKPEHIDKVEFSTEEASRRLTAYQDIVSKAEKLKKRIPAHLQDAYFQLIFYPVLGAAKMNEKHIYSAMGRSDKSLKAYTEIKTQTRIYNKEIAGGKWDGMMSMRPRSRAVFRKLTGRKKSKMKISKSPELALKTIAVTDLEFDTKKVHIIPGLGVDGQSLSRINFKALSYQPEEVHKAPSASIKLKLPKGQRYVKLICVPTHAIHEGRGLRTAIRIDDSEFQILDVHTPSKTTAWKKNVIRGYSLKKAAFELKEDGFVNLQVALLDPGLAISKIVIY